jgi:hypothetical protein
MKTFPPVKRRVRFGDYRVIPHHGMDGREAVFEFEVVDAEYAGTPEEESKKETHTLPVRMSKLRLQEWAISENDVVKILFEFGHRYVAELIKTEKLSLIPAVVMPMITTLTHPDAKCPFNPARIKDPNGAEFIIEVDPPRIGFK